MRILPGLVIPLIAYLCVGIAYAQTDLSGLGLSGLSSDVTITASPENPTPRSVVTISVSSSLFDLTHSSITIRANNVIVSQGVGETSATITTGSIGSPTNISVNLIAPDGTQASNHITIIPTEVDLLLDSDSYVPPFYHGRALPSAGTHIRAVALPYFKQSNGSFISSANIIYIWKEGGQVLGSVSGKGKSSVFLPAPPLFGTTVVEVDAQSVDGNFSGSASELVSAAAPRLLLYVDDPLFGIMYYNTIQAQTTLNVAQTTFAAVPYFAQAISPNDQHLRYTWRLNGVSIPVSSVDQSEITINAKNSNGSAALGLSLDHTTNIFLNATGSWNITFLKTSGGNSQNSATNLFLGGN